MKKYLVAIGGGEIRTGETKAIDQEIVCLSQKINPTLLFIPAASGDSITYCNTVKKVYSELGATVDCLFLCENAPDAKIIKEKMLSADIVYIGGGDTKLLMNALHKHGVDRMLVDAYERGVVLSGLSAGAICLSNKGPGDPFVGENSWIINDWDKGLGLLAYSFCPHYDEEWPAFHAMFKGEQDYALAVENNVAIILEDQQMRICKSDPKKQAYRLQWDKDRIKRRRLV